MRASTITSPFLSSLCLLGALGLPRAAGGQDCVFPNRDFDGTTIVADRRAGVSSDGHGPYRKGEGGVIDSRAGSEGALGIDAWNDTIKNRRSITVNLSKPVPGGGGVPLGTVVGVGGFVTQRSMVGDTIQNLVDIAVGQTVPAGLMSVSLFINGRLSLLQMGPVANGHCMGGKNLVHGTGTSSGTILRASPTKWVIDLPAGSVGRLFDMQGSDPAGQRPTHSPWEQAVDKGLYYVQLRYEIIDAVPYAKNVLLPVAEASGGPAVVSRYRALKRDSSSAYILNQQQLNAAGFWLLNHMKANDAVDVFRLTVEEYPEAASAYDNLGRAYLATADTAKAIANLKRSLELNPGNQHAADVLRRVGANP